MQDERKYFVYIITNYENTVLYVGVTNDLCRRIYEHKNKKVSGFTAKYSVYKLVYATSTKYISDAIKIEKQIKGWKRQKKIDLINSVNPDWKELSPIG